MSGPSPKERPDPDLEPEETPVTPRRIAGTKEWTRPGRPDWANPKSPWAAVPETSDDPEPPAIRPHA